MAEKQYREAIKEALREELQRDENVFILGEEVGVWGGTYAVTRGLRDEFGDKRVRDTPIAEAGIIGTAVGAAMGGLRPIAELMTINFSLIAMDQIVNNMAKIHSMFGGRIRVPMVIRMPAGWGQLAATHSQSFESWLAHVPGLKVVMPANPADAKGLLKSAIRDDNPIVFIEHRGLYWTKGEVPADEALVPIGEASIVRRGEEITIVALSSMVGPALAAAKDLAAEEISAEVIDPRTISPLDIETIASSVKKTSRMIVAHEAVEQGGIGAEIIARVQQDAFHYLDSPIGRVAAPFAPVPASPTLEKRFLPNKEKIIEAARAALAHV